MLWQLIGTCVFAVFLYKAITFLLEWRKLILICQKIPSIGPAHWFWGHVNQFSSTFEKAEKERALIKKTGAKINCTWLGPFYPLLGVCHAETAKLLFKSMEPKPVFKAPGGYFFLKDWLGMGLLLSYGRKWERNRRLLTPAFHFDILKPYVNIYNEVADKFVSNIKQHMDSERTVEIYYLVGMATLDTMLRCAFSYKSDVQTNSNHPYLHAVKTMVIALQARVFSPLLHSDFMYNLSPIGREVKRQSNYVHRFAEELISARRKSLKDDPDQIKKRHLDFLDILITAKDTDGTGLSDEDIRAEVDTFLFEGLSFRRGSNVREAGHDTTASAVSWSLYHLAKYPDEQQKVYDEVRGLTDGEENFTWENINACRHLNLFIKESNRQASPVPLVSRILTKPFVFDGFEIPAGVEVNIQIHHINNHPDVWPDYDVFRPERFLDEEARKRDPYAYVPFSAGPRNCIGQHFALDEQKVLIARTLLRYKMSLVPDFEYIQDHEAITRAKNGIKLKIEERH